MRARDFSLGGEQSGHVVLLDVRHHRGRDADGAARCSRAWCRPARSLAELAAVVQKLPQVLINVAGDRPARGRRGDAVAEAVNAVEAELGRDRAGAAAPVGHRAARPGDGRGAHPGAGRARSPPAWQRSSPGSVLTAVAAAAVRLSGWPACRAVQVSARRYRRTMCGIVGYVGHAGRSGRRARRPEATRVPGLRLGGRRGRR